MTLLELSKQIFFAEIKNFKQFWTLKRKVEFKVKRNKKRRK